ncbi:phytoene desaturase family protein [Nocardioides marmotae]|uniref:phytoene desaturase family protein n=1 Tax=Nocardioides marmotae TaxID=2663857 RepID=UPI0012B59B7B|nr:phytoene desaturase family protein [Nocardioides marmotae]MBC9734149.1 phytoene desaturase [Nocardioides marmotae]MTB85252.1 phytoene desaturase [Nocardioides marmotae]
MRAPGTAVVVGGGITGLATAALLAADGWSVDLLEQREEIGGRAGSWEADGFRFDTGPSWYLMPEVFEHFFAMLGTSAAEQLDLVRLDPGYRVFFEGRDEHLDIAADRDANIALFESVQPGAGGALAAYLDSARHVYDLAVQQFLYTSFESSASLLSANILLNGPRLAGLLTRSLESHVAARFADPRLRQVLGYPAVFLGTSPDRAPSMYHLMSWMDLADGVLYPRGGFTTLIAAIARLAEQHGARIRLGCTVEEVRTRPGGRRGRAVATGVTYVDATGTRTQLDADVVVGAADLHHLETRLLPQELQTYPESWWRKRDAGPGAVLALLGVDGALPELAHHSLFFTSDWRGNFDDIFGNATRVPDPASIYVCRPSATDETVAPAGKENLFVLVPVPADPGIGRGGDDGAGDPAVEKAVDAAIEQVASWAGVPDLASRVEVRRTIGPADFAEGLNSWQGGALGPGHVLKQSAFFRAGNVSRKVEGLFYAGYATRPGIGLPMCLISAELVLKRLREDRSTGPSSEPAA